MELTTWLSLATICVIGALTPGPSLAIVLQHTLAGGRVNGIVASLAHSIGIAIYAVLTIIGLAIIIQQTPWLFSIIKYAGVMMLLWLAYKALTCKSSLASLADKKEQVTIKQSCWQGFLIALLNPKLVIFFLALFGQFVDADAGWQQNVIMVATVVGIDTLWYCLVAIVLSQSFLLTKLTTHAHIVDKVTGIALITVAARAVI